MHSHHLGIAFLVASFGSCAAPEVEPEAPTETRPPNIVIVLADDLGYGDLGCFGAPASVTPHLDRMAEEGVRLTDFYVAQPVCSASRAALLTGCYPNRIGIHGALGPGARHGIAAEETTLAELCRGAGYRTAIFGKWHLGHHPAFLPTRHGFERYYGIPYSNDMWPFHPESPDAWPDLPTFEGEEIVGYNVDQRGMTAELARRAVEFIDECAAADERFMLYLAHPMPHVPLFTSEAFAGRTGRGIFADVVAEIDASVGAILEALDAHDIDRETLVVFTSDNGPWLSYGDHAGSAGGLREGKGTSFEGGVRVPFIARWPDGFPAGHVSAEPAMTIDLLPTIAGLLDVELPERPIDGEDIGPLLSGEAGARSPHEALLFYYHQGDLESLRSGRWKLHFPHGYRTMAGRDPGRDGIPGKYDYGARTGLELYDLWQDPAESRDVSRERPGVVLRLTDLANRARADLGDRLTEVPGTGVREPGRL